MSPLKNSLTDDELCSRVRALLEKNTHEGYSELLNAHYCYVQPSPKKYPFQWFWDTCFHVFMFCALKDYELAKRDLRSLFAMQEQSGFVGHMIFWKSVFPTSMFDILQSRFRLGRLRPHMSALIQPTFVAQALERIYDETNDLEFLQEMFPKVKNYLDWLGKTRDLDGDGLISIISPFESGMDYKPSFDEVLGFKPGKPNWRLFAKAAGVDFHNFIRHYNLKRIVRSGKFLVKEVTVNTTYAKDLLALSSLCAKLGWDAEAQRYKALAERVTKRMMEIMFDEETLAFYDVVSGSNRMLKVLTPTILFPALLPGIPDGLLQKIMKKHFLSPNEFATPYSIPSVARNEPSFFPEDSWYLWRGPTWIFTNWFLFHSLLEHDFHEKADEILDATKALIEKSGFREYYDPFTGEGLGEQNFTWSGFVVDMMRIHGNRRHGK